MRNIIFCSECKRKYYDTGDGINTPYHYDDGETNRRYQFFYCQSCGSTICDSCEKTHNCVQKDEVTKGNSFGEILMVSTKGLKIKCLKCDEEMKFEGYCKDEHYILVHPEGHNCQKKEEKHITTNELLDELHEENGRKIGAIVDYICDKIYLIRQNNNNINRLTTDINRKDIKTDIRKILEGK